MKKPKDKDIATKLNTFLKTSLHQVKKSDNIDEQSKKLLEQYHEELKRRYKRGEDQFIIEKELERYRKWLANLSRGTKIKEFVRIYQEGSDIVKEFGNRPVILDNRYEILDKISGGKKGRGCLYKVLDRRLRCTAAIRMIMPSQSRPEELEKAEGTFIEQANLLFNLHHSGLPKVSDFFIGKDPETGGKAFFLVMTFIEGKDLETIMKERNGRPLAENEALVYFRQILDILIFLHSRFPPIVYGLMKPSHVRVHGRTTPPDVTDSGSVKMGRIFLMDFGITRIVSSIDEPEAECDPANDLYSLASLICFLLSGKSYVMDRSLKRVPEPVRTHNPDVSERTDNILRSIFENFAADRGETPERIIALLEGREEPKVGEFEPIKPRAVIDEFPPQVEDAKPSLLEAVYAGDVTLIRELLEAGADVNSQYEEGNTLLHHACLTDNRRTIKTLISSGAQVNAKNEKGQTPLHLAAGENRKAAVEILVQKSADVKVTDDEGMTPLHRASDQENEEIVEILMEAWTRSIYEEESKVTPAGISKGTIKSDHSETGMTELHQAVDSKNLEKTRKLLDQGVYVDPRDNEGRTPLHIAAEKGLDKIAEMLLAWGADPMAVDVFGSSTIDAAKESNREKASQILEKALEKSKQCGDLPSESVWAKVECLDDNNVEKDV